MVDLDTNLAGDSYSDAFQSCAHDSGRVYAVRLSCVLAVAHEFIDDDDC